MTAKKKIVASAKKLLGEARKEARRETLKLAGRMGELTNTKLTQADLDIAAKNQRSNPSRTKGALSCWKEGDEISLNIYGKEVGKNRQIVQRESYKIQKEKDYGGAKWLREHSHNLLRDIPVYSVKYSDHISISADGRSFVFAETPETWNKKV